MAGFRYLSPDHLQGFNRYKYSCRETSPLAVYVILPLYDRIVKVFPMWVAPNLLTFSGWLLLTFNFWLLAYYDWDYNTSSSDRDLHRQPIPSAVWIYCGVAHLVAYSLDEMDGKQARRTSSSSPLGELFDHGCDSWSTILVPLGLMSAFGRGSPWGGSPHDALFPCLAMVCGFYLCHWEKFITGCLYLPWIYDLIQLGCSAGYIATGVFGVELWHFYCFEGWTFAMVLKWVMILGFLGSIPMSLYNIYEYYNKSGSDDKGAGSSSPTPPSPNVVALLSPWIPIVIFAVLYVAWAKLSQTDIVEREPRIFLFSMGILFSNIACRLIISQMSGQPAQLFNYLLIPLAGAVVLALALPRYEITVLYVYSALVLLVHLHYVISIMEELSEHLHIYVFSLAKRDITTGH